MSGSSENGNQKALMEWAAELLWQRLGGLQQHWTDPKIQSLYKEHVKEILSHPNFTAVDWAVLTNMLPQLEKMPMLHGDYQLDPKLAGKLMPFLRELVPLAKALKEIV